MDRKWTIVMFALGGLILAYLLTQTGMWVWDYLSTSDFAGDYVGKPSQLWVSLVGVVLAAGGTVMALKNERLYELAGEVVTELSKVTWPTREETFTSTIVVIVTVIVSSLFLGVFDWIWAALARFIYG
jgi:preprotein translocase subunit SecE